MRVRPGLVQIAKIVAQKVTDRQKSPSVHPVWHRGCDSILKRRPEPQQGAAIAAILFNGLKLTHRFVELCVGGSSLLAKMKSHGGPEICVATGRREGNSWAPYVQDRRDLSDRSLPDKSNVGDARSCSMNYNVTGADRFQINGPARLTSIRFRLKFLFVLPRLMRGVSRSSRYAGRDAVARQRQAGARVAGRKPGARACALYKGRVQGPEAREGFSLRRTTALRGANRGGDVPHWHRLSAPAQVVWSRRPKLASVRRRAAFDRRRKPSAGMR